MYVFFARPHKHVDEHRVRTDTLRSTGDQELGWMAMYVVFPIFLSPPPGC